LIGRKHKGLKGKYRSISHASKQVGLEVKAEESKYMLISKCMEKS
jgi:hypothetical protein